MTKPTEAPERIWLGGWETENHGAYPNLCGRTLKTAVALDGYVRADLYEALQRQVAKLTAERDAITSIFVEESGDFTKEQWERLSELVNRSYTRPLD